MVFRERPSPFLKPRPTDAFRDIPFCYTFLPHLLLRQTAKTKQTGKMGEETLRDFYALCVMFFWDIMLRKCNGCRFGYLLSAGVFSLSYSPKKTHRAVGGERLPDGRLYTLHKNRAVFRAFCYFSLCNIYKFLLSCYPWHKAYFL